MSYNSGVVRAAATHQRASERLQQRLIPCAATQFWTIFQLNGVLGNGLAVVLLSAGVATSVLFYCLFGAAAVATGLFVLLKYVSPGRLVLLHLQSLQSLQSLSLQSYKPAHSDIWSKYARGVATPKEVGSEELATVQYSPLATLMLFRDSKMLLLIAIIAYNGFSYVVDQCCCAREHERDREVRDIYRLFTYSLWCSAWRVMQPTHAQASVLLWRLPTTVWISPDCMGLDVVFVMQHDRYVAVGVGRLCHSEVD